MNKLFVCFLFVCLSSFSNDKALFVDCWRKNNILPYNLQVVLGALDEFENQTANGVYVDLSVQEGFFDTEKKMNCIEHCFLPIRVGKGELERVPNYQKSILQLRTYCEMLPKRANHLINKYIKIKPEINQKFSEWLGRKYEIGVYYSTKRLNGLEDLVPHQKVIEKLNNHYQGGTIFVVTQDLQLRELIKQRFPGKVVVFLGYGYNEIEQDLLSLLVLSKCSALIAHDDVFSSCVSYFNPHLKTILLDTNWLKSF